MTEKIVQLAASERLNHRALLHQILERDGVEAVVIVVRINGKYDTCWAGEINRGGLCMASMKLQHDVMHDIQDAPDEIEEPSRA